MSVATAQTGDDGLAVSARPYDALRTWLPLALILAAAIAMRYFVGANTDVSWEITLSEKILDGQRLMVVFGFVVALLRERADNTMRDHWLLIAVWTLPATMMFAGAIGIPLAPVVLIAFACWLLRRLALGDSSEVRALPEATVLAPS
jgi:uncharacterized membrane protein YecN with MAPEG domain